MYGTDDEMAQELADGGLVGRFANAISERILGRPPAPPTPAASSAAAPAQPASAPARPPGGAIGSVMQRREAAAGLADGGPVLPEDEQPLVPENGVIQGPGGPVDDAIATEMPTGSYVVPADVTQALVSAGEAALSPEVIAAASAAFLDVIKQALHTPAEEQPQSPAAPADMGNPTSPPQFANGGPVKPRNALQQRRAAMQAQKLADGGLVDEQRRQQSIAQIPTGGQTAPSADGSQGNVFTGSEVGRNLSNAASALSGVSGPLASAAQAMAPTARTLLQAPATATRAATTATDQATNAGSALRRWAPVAGLGGGALAGGAAGSDTAPTTPSSPLARPAAGAGLPPFNDARFEVARGNYADSRTPGQAGAPAPAPATDALREPGKIYRQGNSYSGTGNIQDGAEIVGARAALSRPGGISPQNEAAAQALADRSGRESLGRVLASMQPQQQAAPATPFVASGGSFGFRRAPQIEMAEQASIAGFNRARGTDPRSLANAAAARLSAQQDQSAFARTALQEDGAMNRELVRERGLGLRAIAQARASGTPPPGYQWGSDGRSLQAIPGGPADIKAGELGAKSEARQQSQAAQAVTVRDTIKDARDLVGWNTAGVGGVMAKVPATDARNLQSKLETIKANLGFDRLQQMRDESPTGGALGAVAVQELVALQSTVASLDQLQSPKELSGALKKIDQHYTRWQSVVERSRGGGAAAPAQGADGAGHLAELRRRAASDPKLAERLRAEGY